MSRATNRGVTQMPQWPTEIRRLFLRRSPLRAILRNMESSFRHFPYLLGALAIAVGAGLASATALQQAGRGIVVLHFIPSTSSGAARDCRLEGKNSGGARTLFHEYRTRDGTPLTISGHVAL